MKKVATLLFLVVLCAWAATENIIVNFDASNGNFTILIDDAVWFQSGDVFFRESGTLFSTSDKSLVFNRLSESKEKDKLGAYSQYELSFSADNGKEFLARVKQYDNFFVFEQRFSRLLCDTSSGNADGLITGFPSFTLSDSDAGAGYANWISWFYQSDNSQSNEYHRNALVAPGFSTPQFGKWDSNTNMTGGVGGTGVVAVFDDKSTAVILAPLTNPMAVSHITPSPGHLQYGIMGNVTEVPADFSIDVMMFIGREGVNQAVTSWGETVRNYYGKQTAAESRAKDITLQYLGFTTDNGAYYYYHTEPNQNYEQTLVAVKAYADWVGIPYKYVLLDSWWYYKGSNGGVSNWTALPDIFPNGVEALYQQTGWFVQAHNRYWSLDNPYAKSQGGEFEFIEDPVKNGAVPVGQNFWESIFKGPAQNWGLKVYEQDWLFNEFYEYVSQMLESVHLGRMWLLQMGAAAEKTGLTVQYCMPFIRHLLQSLEVPAATQARASDDYVVSPYTGVDNWRIGGQSLLIDALGMAPSKDGYWSTSHQTSNPYGEERYEPYPRLQAAVTALSAGPVAIADGINFSDVELIMRSCTDDGRLLQPSSPATMINAQFLQSAIGGSLGPKGEVWFAPSVISGHTYGSLFVADLAEDWSIKPSDVGLDSSSAFYVFEANNTAKLIHWSEEAPLLLKSCGYADFALYTIVPIQSSGWAFLGEEKKWVGVSPSRFISMTHERNYSDGSSEGFYELSVKAVGTMFEEVNVGFVSPEGTVVQFNCTVGHSDYVLISSKGGCVFEFDSGV